MEISLIKSKKEDLKEIAKVYATEFSKPPYNEKWTFKKAINKISFFNQYYDLYTIKGDNKILGFICINPTFMCPGEIAFGEDIAIKEEFQNKGVGTFVFKIIFDIYKKKGFKRFLGIVDVDSRATKLYNRLGLKLSKKNILIERNL